MPIGRRPWCRSSERSVRAFGRTLVVPASEGERELACSFAVRLAEAPWLAAGVLDVDDAPVPLGQRLAGARARAALPANVPARGGDTVMSPSSAPPSESPGRYSSRTLMGMPSSMPNSGPYQREGDSSEGGSRRRRRISSASLRVAVGGQVSAATDDASVVHDQHAVNAGELSAPKVLFGDEARSNRGVLDRITKPDGSSEPPPSSSANAVMLAAIRILSDEPDVELEEHGTSDEVAIALGWNGPLSGPTLRRACRLSDRVIVVVRSGAIRANDLGKVKTRLGRDGGVGYVLVDAARDVLDLEDRVGNVAAFWDAAPEA